MRYSGLCLVLLLVACESGPPSRSGFLDDYSKLEQVGKRPHAWVWEKPGVDMRVYDRLMFDPVEVRLLEGSQAGELGKETLRKVAAAFRRIMTETIDPYYSVVSKRGPYVLRVRLAVTDVAPAQETGKGGPKVRMGQATMEGEFLDSVSGAHLAAFTEKISGSAAGKGKAPPEWRHVEGAFQEWANALLDYMDRKHAGVE
ncbi:MAG: DUF3313 domain-containing protein [Planctomycetota bacterium]|jgi:hypothetical protein